MPELFAKLKKTILITGANGWVGRNLAAALQKKYRLILVDNKYGEDPGNRFSLEKVSYDFNAIPESQFQKIDLVDEAKAFADLLTDRRPDLVIHAAGVLENSELAVIEKNFMLNENVLTACASYKIPIISLSSIMVAYGAALANEKIRSACAGEEISFNEDEKITVDTPRQNTETSARELAGDDWQKVDTYIKAKEHLEDLSQTLSAENSQLPMVTVRLGWTGLKDPRKIEEENRPRYTEIPVYLAVEDMQQFFVRLTNAVLQETITGYKNYFCCSNHPQSWISMKNAEEFGWQPKVNIADIYPKQVQYRPVK